MPGSAHTVSVGSASQSKDTDHTVMEASTASAYSEKQKQKRKLSRAPPTPPLAVPTGVTLLAEYTIPCSTLTLAISHHPALRRLEENLFPFADEPLRTGKESHHLGPTAGDSSPGRFSPMQLGWVPLHVPSDWQNRRGEPTSTRGGWQEKETDDL